MESSVISTLCPREKGTSICWLVLFRLVWSGWECSVNVEEGRGEERRESEGPVHPSIGRD